MQWNHRWLFVCCGNNVWMKSLRPPCLGVGDESVWHVTESPHSFGSNVSEGITCSTRYVPFWIWNKKAWKFLSWKEREDHICDLFFFFLDITAAFPSRTIYTQPLSNVCKALTLYGTPQMDFLNELFLLWFSRTTAHFQIRKLRAYPLVYKVCVAHCGQLQSPKRVSERTML